MTIKTSAVDARKNLGRFLNLVLLKGEEVVIERDGRAVAKLCPVTGAERPATGRLDLRKIRGLGRELWKQVDVARYVGEERDSWG
jgi:antitoxin (DNA-binding transcriptional repressor) of toxin-antitoxin stability system